MNQIQIFLEAVNCGSISGAAEALHVTQPMVSKTIQALEKELGIILFKGFPGFFLF
ncbi:MAG: LysR family transcriptional regulator [Parasporobacterium sp.]|nr:LysR family transcriptional regulator [Parasporobacterium sp.]